uniref:Bromodomain containing 8a n=1 Tax=Cyprinus carpio carpio TaxID=630221 RepID=A0A9J8CJP4_CYPCA
MRLTAQHRDVFECCLHLKCVLLFIFCLFILWTEHKLLLGPTEPWSVREKLCLASSVMKSGDQNWVSVSRAIKPFAEPGRPPDWFSQKHCASQYSELLETTEAPK